MLALPAVLESKNQSPELLVMLAVPAVLELLNCRNPLLVMLALPPLMVIPAPVKSI